MTTPSRLPSLSCLPPRLSLSSVHPLPDAGRPSAQEASVPLRLLCWSSTFPYTVPSGSSYSGETRNILAGAPSTGQPMGTSSVTSSRSNPPSTPQTYCSSWVSSLMSGALAKEQGPALSPIPHFQLPGPAASLSGIHSLPPPSLCSCPQNYAKASLSVSLSPIWPPQPLLHGITHGKGRRVEIAL